MIDELLLIIKQFQSVKCGIIRFLHHLLTLLKYQKCGVFILIRHPYHQSLEFAVKWLTKLNTHFVGCQLIDVLVNGYMCVCICVYEYVLHAVAFQRGIVPSSNSRLDWMWEELLECEYGVVLSITSHLFCKWTQNAQNLLALSEWAAHIFDGNSFKFCRKMRAHISLMNGKIFRQSPSHQIYFSHMCLYLVRLPFKPLNSDE